MASGARFGARVCCRLHTSTYCFTRTRRLTTNSVTCLSKCRSLCAMNTVCDFKVSQKRLYTNENRAGFEDPFSVMTQDVQADNLSETAASGDTTGSELNEGPDPGMQELLAKYERYKLWLAKIMGKDPETFSEKDVKEALEYLMPSGLYAKDARPIFEDPSRLYQKNATLLDKNSRPLHAAFFTGQIGFHDLLFEIYQQAANLNADEQPEVIDKMRTSESQATDPDSKYSDSDTDSSSESDSESSSDSDLDTNKDLETDTMPDLDWDASSGKIYHQSDSLDGQGTKETKSTKPASHPKMRWIGKPELERKIRERLTDKEYDVIIHRLKRLASHPNAERATPFLLQFLHVVPVEGMRAAEKTLNDQGEAVAVGHRKRAVAEVVVKKGSGNVTINNTPMTKYFRRLEDRKQIMYPFLTVDAVGEYDVDCGVIGGGTSGQAGAIRLAISRALLNFEDSYLEPLQQAGLLIRDPRIKERKKPGQKRARKKFAWVRR